MNRKKCITSDRGPTRTTIKAERVGWMLREPATAEKPPKVGATVSTDFPESAPENVPEQTANCTPDTWLELLDGSIVRRGWESAALTWPESRCRPLVGAEYPPLGSPETPDAICAAPRPKCSKCGTAPVLPAAPGSDEGLCFYCWK